MVPEGVIRPMLSPSTSVNHRFPSGPAAIPHGITPAVGMENSVKVPVGVIRPILFAEGFSSVNHRFPSGPAAISTGSLLGVGVENSVIVPDVVIRPILLTLISVNHRFPS